MKFSLVIPCYNEAQNLALLFDRCSSLIKSHGIEIIIVDNGSTDASNQIIESLIPFYPLFKCVRVDNNQGYGFGILAGLKVATGDILGWTHADMQTDPCDVLRAVKLFQRYGENVFIKGFRCGRPLVDTLFTIGMSVFETFLLGKIMWDINAQPTMFSRRFFESWDDPPHDFSLDLYAYFKAHKFGCDIHRFSVFFRKRLNGSSSWNTGWIARKNFIKRTMSYSFALKRSLRCQQ